MKSTVVIKDEEVVYVDICLKKKYIYILIFAHVPGTTEQLYTDKKNVKIIIL